MPYPEYGHNLDKAFVLDTKVHVNAVKKKILILVLSLFCSSTTEA